jgi:uroporphyrinogen decarboxylase
MALNHRERILACMNDDSILDRPPVALWRHFPVDDQDPDSLADASLDFQLHYDFDLVKVTPASSFSTRDWGTKDAWEGNPEGTRRYTRRVVEAPEDWEKLAELPPTANNLERQLACLRKIRASLPAATPLIQTIFSPLAQAKNLAGPERLLDHLHRCPEAVMHGLKTISLTTRRFVQACLETGIDGIFFAVQHAQAGLLSLEEYREFGLPNDLVCLEPAASLWCNMLHLHGLRVHFELLSRNLFPPGLFQIVNWHDRETSPSLSEGKSLFPGVVCGGISQNTISLGERKDVEQEALQAIHQTGGRRFMLGTGCVAPVITPRGNLVIARRVVERTQ